MNKETFEARYLLNRFDALHDEVLVNLFSPIELVYARGDLSLTCCYQIPEQHHLLHRQRRRYQIVIQDNLDHILVRTLHWLVLHGVRIGNHLQHLDHL